jgi:hypothetical protein
MSEQHRHTPFNTPMPQWQPSAPEDPTAIRLVEGGSLKLNDHDRTGLAEWFQQSFRNQFDDNSWFTRNWFPALMEPIYRAFNANFDELTDLISKSAEEIAEFRLEVLTEVTKTNAEMAKGHAEIATTNKEMADEIRAAMNRDLISWTKTKEREILSRVAEVRQRALAKCNEDLDVMRQDLLAVLRREMMDEVVKANADWIKIRDLELAKHIETVVETTRTEMMTRYDADLKSMHANVLHVLRQELAQEIIKMRGKDSVKGKK